MLALIARKSQRGGEEEGMRADLARSGDDFIRALATLAQIETVGVGRSTGLLSRAERVPPTGVPAWAACSEVTSATFHCRSLATLEGVASGTPLYYLKPSQDWRTVPAPSAANPNSFWRQLGRLLGRRPRAAEVRLLFDFVALGVTWDHSNLQSIGPCGRCVALTVTQSLGVRARVVRGSDTVLPLPRGPLPAWVTRAHTGLYQVVYDVLRPNGDRAGRHALYVYVNCSAKFGPPGLCQVVWVERKP